MKKKYLLLQLLLIVVILNETSSFKYKKKSNQKHRLQKKNFLKSKEDVELAALDERIEKMEEIIGKVEYINKESFRTLMKNRGMIPGEIQFLFSTIDIDKRNKINQVQWQSFFKVFIEPFEKCDKDKNWKLTTDEVGECLEEAELKGLGLSKDNSTQLMELINKNDENLFTFADYMYLRRANIGWGDCAGGTIMSRINIPCGMKVVVPGLIATEQDVKMIMDVVMAFSSGKESQSDPYLHLMDFIKTSYIYYYFYAFQIPYENGLVKKQDMIRAVDYQIVSVGLNNGVINQIFGEATELNLKTFSCSLIIYQWFRKFSKAKPFQLAEEEFLAMLKQISFSQAFLKTVDNVYIPTKEEYEAASQRPEIAVSERDFLVTFLQTSYKQRKHQGKNKIKMMKGMELSNKLRFKTKQNDENYDEDKQKLIYRQFEYKNQQALKFPDLLRFFKFTWMFINYDTDGNNLLTYQEIRNGIENYDPPLTLTLKETQWTQWAQDFIANPILDELDLKQWYSMCMFYDVFGFYKQSAFTSFITEAKLKLAIYELGFQTTQTTLDLSRVSKDPTTQEPLYNYWTAYKSVVKEEIICQKNHTYEEVQKIVEETVKLF